MRRDSPEKFCFSMCASFTVLAYIGSFISAFCLFYYLTVGGLVVPGCLKYILRNHPPAQELFVNLRILEEIKCKKIRKDKRNTTDEVDGSSSCSGLVDLSGAADTVQSIVQNVCSTLQTGVSSIASNLPDLHQVSLLENN